MNDVDAMTHHVQRLFAQQDTDGAFSLMERLKQRFAQYINRTYQRSGTLGEGRCRSYDSFPLKE